MKGPIVLGSTWRKAMRRCCRPSARAASMYCISRMDSTLARMMRAARGMMGIEMAMTTFWTDGPSAADITRASTSKGNPCRMSSSRWEIRSVFPPKYALSSPMIPPKTLPRSVDSAPTTSETRAP